MADGKLLETGGMVYITATCSGEKLQLKKGIEMEIEFVAKGKIQGMETFIGKAAKGQVNWVPQKQLYSNSSILKELNGKIRWVQKYRNSDGYTIYYQNGTCVDYGHSVEVPIDTAEIRQTNAIDNMILKSGQLGWINCDRFYNVKEKTNLVIEVDTAFSPTVRLVFKDINSVMSGYYTQDKKMGIYNIPVGKKATIIAFCIVNAQPYFVSKDIVISKDQIENLKLIKTTMAALKTDMEKLN
jgi:hypothetical protein